MNSFLQDPLLTLDDADPYIRDRSELQSLDKFFLF